MGVGFSVCFVSMFLFVLAEPLGGWWNFSSPNQRSNPGPQQWEGRVLTTGPPGNSLSFQLTCNCWWRFVVKSPAVMSSCLDLHTCDLIFYYIWNEPVRELIQNDSRAFSAKQELQLRQEAQFPAKLWRARPHWALGTKWEVQVGAQVVSRAEYDKRGVWDTTEGNGQNSEAGRTGTLAQILASVNPDTYLYISVYLQPRIMKTLS